ncbi:cell division protein FtsQ [Ligilactobacillus salitolerans]|uniref:Cell division protein DivIB n=1 Tax=Ligilactobacillus salitolerans TaxID=1808352 RepID=A0A401IQY8_9LACO|nr:cell division protein FtsQ/DivIB [Ligilactobacillus salitolerans]GBG93946.1 cell division protein FtsQ [Ligilactobacillus salitolerans]
MESKRHKNKKNKRSAAPLTPWEKQQQLRAKRLATEKKKKIIRPRYDKNLPKTKKKRTQRLKQHEKVLLLGFTMVTLIALYCILPISRVTSVDVQTAHQSNQGDILQASGLKYYESLFFVWPRTSQIEERIKKEVPAVKSVDISYQGSKIAIKAKEYATIGYLKKGSSYYRLTSAGTTENKIAAKLTGSYPTFYSFADQKDLKEIAGAFAKLSPEIKQNISEVHALPSKVDPQRIRVYMNDGNQVLAKIATFAEKMKYYPNMAASMDQAGVVDIEVGAYSYPYPKK